MQSSESALAPCAPDSLTLPFGMHTWLTVPLVVLQPADMSQDAVKASIAYTDEWRQLDAHLGEINKT